MILHGIQPQELKHGHPSGGAGGRLLSMDAGRVPPSPPLAGPRRPLPGAAAPALGIKGGAMAVPLPGDASLHRAIPLGLPLGPRPSSLPRGCQRPAPLPCHRPRCHGVTLVSPPALSPWCHLRSHPGITSGPVSMVSPQAPLLWRHLSVTSGPVAMASPQYHLRPCHHGVTAVSPQAPSPWRHLRPAGRG